VRADRADVSLQVRVSRDLQGRHVGKPQVYVDMSRTDVVLCQRIVQLTRRKKLSAGKKAKIQFLLRGASGGALRLR
jgi:hypothetical protein